jgi:hypothetical protein
MNPMNTPATAWEPGTADVRAVGSNELARVEGGIWPVCKYHEISREGGTVLVALNPWAPACWQTGGMA